VFSQLRMMRMYASGGRQVGWFLSIALIGGQL
jgi:hypothetical protein